MISGALSVPETIPLHRPVLVTLFTCIGDTLCVAVESTNRVDPQDDIAQRHSPFKQ